MWQTWLSPPLSDLFHFEDVALLSGYSAPLKSAYNDVSIRIPPTAEIDQASSSCLLGDERSTSLPVCVIIYTLWAERLRAWTKLSLAYRVTAPYRINRHHPTDHDRTLLRLQLHWLCGLRSSQNHRTLLEFICFAFGNNQSDVQSLSNLSRMYVFCLIVYCRIMTDVMVW